MSSKSDGTLDRNLGVVKISAPMVLNGESNVSKITETKIVNPSGLNLATFGQQQPRPRQTGENTCQLKTLPFTNNLNTNYSSGSMQQQPSRPSPQLIAMSTKVSTAGR